MDAVDARSPLRRNRDFVCLWVGQVASALGTQAAAIAYPLLALAMTGSASTAGALAFARTIPWLLFVLPAGAIVDRVDRKRIMLVCDTAALTAMTTVAAALAVGELALLHLFVAVFVEGTAYVFLRLAYTGALRQLVPREQLPDAVAYSTARQSASSLAGPPLGGILFGLSRSLPFVANAVSYLVSLVSLLLIKTPFQEARVGPPGRLGAEIREGLAWLWQQPFLRTSLLLVGGCNFFTAALSFILIVVAREGGASSGLVGAMLAVVAAGGVVGAFAARWVRRWLGGWRIVVGFNWIAAGIVVPLLFASHPLALGAVAAVLTFFAPTWNSVVDGYRISIVPSHLQGRVASADNLIAFSAIPLGPLLAGILLEWAGRDPTLLSFGAWMLALAVAGSLSRSLRVPLPAT